MEQPTTLEGFREQRAAEWGYVSWQDMINSGINTLNKMFEELEVHKRFHAYELSQKDKEIEELKEEISRLNTHLYF